MTQHFPHLKISGAPKQAAQHTAQLLAKEATGLLEFRQKLLRELSLEAALPSTLWDSIQPLHDTHTPYAALESSALAAQLGLPPGQILGFSGLSDLIDLLSFSDSGEWGCSTLALGSLRSPNTAFAQSWDLHKKIEEYSLLLERQIEGSLASLTLTTVLGHAHFGINEAGVCIGTNNLQFLHPQPGVVFSAAIMEVLDKATDANDGVELLCKLPLMSGHNFVIADAISTANVEKTCVDAVVTWMQPDTTFAHTNHYLAPQFQDSGRQYSPSSGARYAHLQEYSKSVLTGAPTLANLREVFSDHSAPICRHAQADTDAATCALLAFHPQEKALSILKGLPCRGTWQTYRWSGQTFSLSE